MLKDKAIDGDIILVCPKNTIGKIIAKVTFGRVNHAAIVYNSNKIFETDGDQFKAKFADISKYDDRDLYIIRAEYIQKEIMKVQRLCRLYDGSPYSYWDLFTNFVFSPLTRQIRSKVVGFFGDKKFMVCSELVSRIVFEATGNKIWKDFEGITPEDIRDIALENPEEHKIIFISSK